MFLFLPLFFKGQFTDVHALILVSLGFIAFSFVASSIYIINDYRDREDDRKHPVKCKRPLASGAVSPSAGLIICAVLFLAGFSMAWFIRDKFAFVLGIYFLINLGYSLGLKSVAILDLILLAAGFVLRIKAGSVIGQVPLSQWIVIMVFLLASTGNDMLKSIKGYNLEFLNTLLALVSAIIIVAYLMYCKDPETVANMHTYRLYYTAVFVMAGIMRYLQLIYVVADAGSPTKILYKDRFIQVTLLLWFASFFIILYFKDEHLFK
jgi:decaprenyl-phosphate phosphoribosyltransferase